MAHIIAVAQHDRQRDQAHGDDRGGHRAGDRTEDRADQNDRVGQAAAQATEQLAKPFEQVFRQTTSLQNNAHEGKEGDRQQQFIRDDRIELERQVAEELGRDDAELDGQEPEEQTDCGKAERGRIADHHEDNQPDEHQGAKVVDQPINH